MNNASFKARVEEIVYSIPSGRVMTYGQIAALAGSPNSARIVGGIAHFGDSNLPWHRVVNKKGGLASGYPGGRKAHQKHLEAEGVVFNSESAVCVLYIERVLWWPNQSEGVIE